MHFKIIQRDHRIQYSPVTTILATKLLEVGLITYRFTIQYMTFCAQVVTTLSYCFGHTCKNHVRSMYDTLVTQHYKSLWYLTLFSQKEILLSK